MYNQSWLSFGNGNDLWFFLQAIFLLSSFFSFHRELHGFDIIAARPTGTESDCERFFTTTVTRDNNPFVKCSSINWKSENVEVNSRKKSWWLSRVRLLAQLFEIFWFKLWNLVFLSSCIGILICGDLAAAGSVATGTPCPSLDDVLIEVSVDFGARRAVEKLLSLWRSNYRYDWNVRFAFV